MKKGIVYLVGAGPGDPGLITVKAVECLKQADVVIYDFLAAPKLLKYARGGAEIIYVQDVEGSYIHGLRFIIIDARTRGRIKQFVQDTVLQDT